MANTEASPCGGCGEPVGRIHQCPYCERSMHPFCGTPIGPEGYGQRVRCQDCSGAQTDPTSATSTGPAPVASVAGPSQVQASHLTSSSPIVAAFARTPLCSKPTDPSNVRADNTGRTHRPSPDPEVGTSSSTSRSPSSAVRVVSSSGHSASKVDFSSHSSAQVVSSISQRRKVLRWMVKTEEASGDELLFSKAVDKFPSIFKSRTRQANLAKATDWWCKRSRYLDAERGSSVLSGRRYQGRVRVDRKCVSGRGRRPSAWVSWLYPVLHAEFDRLRSLGLKFDAPLLRQVALRQLHEPGATYNAQSVDANGSLLSAKITTRWVQVFMEKHRIVLRAHTGKRQVSPEKQAQIEREVASHLGQLKRDFESGKLDENAVENIDETHFMIDFDNGKTLGFVGEKSVKYADVVSGGEGMTMVVRISGGASGYIHPPMMIFTNGNRSYPIRGVADNVTGACYRTGPKGWMDQRLFREYLNERRAMAPDPRGRKKTIFLDNCSGHLEESECNEELNHLNAHLQYLPANATDLCQPADSFVIAKIKDVWSRMWNEKKIKLIEDEEWQNKARKDGSYSGKLKNPGKTFFLELAAAAVREVNQKRDKNGINYARKAMMRCGLSLGIDGTWSTRQLFPHLQEIIKKFPSEFEHAPAAARSSDSLQESGDSEDASELVSTVVMNRSGTEALV